MSKDLNSVYECLLEPKGLTRPGPQKGSFLVSGKSLYPSIEVMESRRWLRQALGLKDESDMALECGICTSVVPLGWKVNALAGLGLAFFMVRGPNCAVVFQTSSQGP